MPDLSALHTFLDSTQKKLGEVVLLAIWGGLAYAARLAWEGFQGWRAAKKAAKQSDPSYLTDKHLRLKGVATRAVVGLDAEHVSIYQFHNGEFFSNRDSIRKLSMVAEDMGSNLVRGWMVESQNLPTAAFPGLMDAIQQRPHAWVYLDECEDFEMNRMLRQRGYRCVVARLLKGPKGGWLGVLAVAWAPEPSRRFTDETLPTAAFDEHCRNAAAILAEQ